MPFPAQLRPMLLVGHDLDQLLQMQQRVSSARELKTTMSNIEMI